MENETKAAFKTIAIFFLAILAVPTLVEGFNRFNKPLIETKFKKGDCVAFYTTAEIEDGYTGRVLSRPTCAVTDFERQVVEVSKDRYTYKLMDFEPSTRELRPYAMEADASHIESNYVRVNCDGRYEDEE